MVETVASELQRLGLDMLADADDFSMLADIQRLSIDHSPPSELMLPIDQLTSLPIGSDSAESVPVFIISQPFALAPGLEARFYLLDDQQEAP